MLNTTRYNQGDVVLVDFVFSDETGARRRPALVLNSDRYNQDRQEVIVAAITSNVRRLLVGDHLVQEWRAAGLLLPSVVTGILRTVAQTMVTQRLGNLSSPDLMAVDDHLKLSLGLSSI